MFLPDNCDSLLTLPIGSEKVNWIGGNRERTIIAIATNSTIYFYLSSHQLLLCTFKRSGDEVVERGPYKKLYWRHNSKSVCVLTASNFVYVYSIDISQDTDCFNLVDSGGDLLTRQSPEFYLKQRRPVVNVSLAVVAKLESEPQCVVSLKDELFVCLADGWIHRLTWNGDVLQDVSFNIRHISFSVDQISAKIGKFPHSSIYVVDFVYCPLIGGLCAVLNDCRAALLVSSTPQFNPQDISAIWANGMNDAVCCAANHKFRLIYFGCKNGDIAGYSLDDSNGALIQVFRIKLSAKNGTEYLSRIGAVRQIQCISQGTVFSAIWEPKKTSAKNESGENEDNSTQLNGLRLENGAENLPTLSDCPPAVAIFSPFGAQWWSSFENSLQSHHCCSYTRMDWGPDGYQLWLGTHGKGVFNINFVRSLPDFLERVLMVGSDRVYLSPLRMHEENASAPHFVWEACKIPYEYIAANWPLRYIGMDEECNRVLVAAGARGFCFCTLKNFKWRLFRKEAQELDLCLTADIVVYKEFVLVAVCNSSNDAETLFAFNLSEQLDKDLAAVSLPVNRVLTMNLRQDYLVTFDITSTITIYSLKQDVIVDPAVKHPKYSLEIECFAEIRVAELLPHPSCVVSIQLTQLNYHTDMAEYCPGYDSLLINISGHLLLLSPLHNQNPSIVGNSTGNSSSEPENTLQLHPPTLIASNVERVWTHLTDRKIPHLHKALWINTGCRKMQIWLPLSHQINFAGGSVGNAQNGNAKEMNTSTKRSFISKRIMLPIDINLYPLTIDEDCLACGAECFTMATSTSYDELTTLELPLDEAEESIKLTNGVTSFLSTRIQFPSVSARSLVRITEVFLHHLLKQLLKRNLGSYALAIASACRSLPYFSHVLELLLHDVLDEEATSSEPIPDPLLPTVISFINEFPEYLLTVVHCARKTELAFWNLLFSVSHHPREIFKMCIEEGDLDTATCCLILLQSMEPMTTSAQYSAHLLEEALSKRRWALARDIVRFMQSIDRSEFELNPESPYLFQKLTSRGTAKQKCSILPADSTATDELMFNASSGSGSATSANIASIRSAAGAPSAPASINLRRQSSGGGVVGSASGQHHSVLSISTNSQHTAQHQTNNVGPATTTTHHTKTSPNTQFSSTSRANSTLRLLTKNPSLDSGNYCNGSATNSFSNFNCQFDEILKRHGSTLLEDFALRDFGAFASHLSLNLKDFFADPQNAFHIPAEDFPLVLMKLHAQFAWPYPMIANGNALLASSQNRTLSAQSDESNSNTGVENRILATITPKNSVVSLASSSTNSMAAMTNGDEKNGLVVANGLKSEDSLSLCSVSTDVTMSTAAEHGFSWKVFEKMCKNSKVKGTKQSESELTFMMNWLSGTDALEWIYLLCILKQDVKTFNEKLLNELNNQKRLAVFLKNVREGTANIHAWAEAKCPAYTPVIRVFKEFLEC